MPQLLLFAKFCSVYAVIQTEIVSLLCDVLQLQEIILDNKGTINQLDITFGEKRQKIAGMVQTFFLVSLAAFIIYMYECSIGSQEKIECFLEPCSFPGSLGP